MMTISEQTIQSFQSGSTGQIVINRPKSLNALSGAMCGQINNILINWATDESIDRVLITATPGKAFCAGGDVRALIPLLKDDHENGRQYFEIEYRLDLIINTYPKPVITLANGLTMGGGAGVLMNAGMQIISDRMDFAMPETAIGLFPDVAASVFLRRAPSSVASFLGITGYRIGAGDMKALGILDPKTSFILDGEKEDQAIAALINLAQCDYDSVAQGLDALLTSPNDTPLMNELDWINKHFDHPDLPAIRASLDGDAHPLAEFSRKAIDSRAPLSMAVTHHLMQDKRFADLSVPQALHLDYNLANRITRNPDFIEGVRAVLIDKDNAPNWSPKTIDDVTSEMLDALFDESDMMDLGYPQGYVAHV